MKQQKPAEFWEKHIAEQKKSGMSQKKYCQSKKIHYRSFEYQIKKRRQGEQEKPCNLKKQAEGNQGGWLPLAIQDEPDTVNNQPGAVRIIIGKAIIETERGFSAPHLKDVLRVVGNLC